MIRQVTRCSKGLTHFAVLWLFLFSVGAVYADNSKISPDLLPLLNNPSQQLNVIVQYNSSPTTCSGGGLLGGVLCTVVKLAGGVVNLLLDVIDGVAGTLTASDVIATSNQSN